jgi:hypothetical protein
MVIDQIKLGGTFKPVGFGFTGSARAKLIINEIIQKYLTRIGVSQLRDGFFLTFIFRRFN